MFVSTRYTLSHRATQALFAAAVKMSIDRGSASKPPPIAGPAFASAPASSTMPTPSRTPRPSAEHRGDDNGSFLLGSSWLQDKLRALQSQSNRLQKSGEKACLSYR